MKKIYSFLVAALVCLLSTTVWADTVTKEEAALLAGQFLSAQKVQTTAPVKKAVSVNSATTLNAKQLTLQQKNAVNALPVQKPALSTAGIHNTAALSATTHVVDGDITAKVLSTPASLNLDQIYIIQEEDEDGGWVIMSANDAVEPILAYSKTGTFRTDNMPINLKGWLGQYNEQIQKVTELGLTAEPAVEAEWKALRKGVRKATQATEVVSALVKTRWDQDDPYYMYCPYSKSNGQSVVGCVATAMAQVMKYWEWPNQGQGSNTYTPAKYSEITVDFNTTYDWSNMPNRCYSTSSEDEKKAVAKLSYHCGVAVNMSYDNSTNGGSGAYTLNYGSDNEVCAQNALWKYFKYDYSTIKSYYRNGSGTTYVSWSQADWIAMLKAELDQKRPIIYSGHGTGGGHCFICDGYDSDSKFHFNWGWSGSNDGFYTINNLVPGSGGSGGGSYSFSNNQGCIIGIQPVVSDKFTVTYNAGTLATCATTTQTQASIGAAVVLPNISSVDEHYIFLGWSDKEGSRTPNIGVPGDSYVPMRNITLYAVVVQDGYVVHFIPKIENGTVAVVVNDTTTLTWSSTPNWSGHGSCDVDSLREDGTGSGIILPYASNDAGWTFQEWIAVNSSGNLYIAGYPGDLFKPSGNMNLFGYWTEDSKVWLDYLLMGVTKTSGPEEGWLEYADGLTATFTAADDFYALTNANTTVTVVVDGETLTAGTDYTKSISGGVLTITISAEKITGDIDITIQATQDYSPCAAYSYTYTASKGKGNSIALGAYTWKITTTGSGATNTYDATLGQRFGTAGAKRATPVSPGTVTYTTSTPHDCHINTVSIDAASALIFTYNDYTNAGGIIPATIELFIGDSSLGAQVISPDELSQVTYNNTQYYLYSATLNTLVWQNTVNLTGDLKFVMDPGIGRSLLYVKSINVSISESVLGGPYHVPVTGLQAYYLPDDDKYVWYTMLYGDGDYPYVLTIFDAADETSFAGTHSTYGISYEPNANEEISSIGSPKITLTYKAANGTYFNTYHATANWQDSEGRQYYIDDDVSALLINYECWAAAKEADEDASLADHTDCIDPPTSDEGGTTIAYTVNHYLQKVEGNEYDLDESVTFNTASGNTVTGAQNSYTGFVTPAVQSITVTNTNKTINYYYNRRTYPVHFVVNNIAVQSDTLRYKATPSYRGEEPKRTATDDYEFTFTGWSPNISPVKQSATYTAQFSAATICTVTFNRNDHGGTAPAKQTMHAGDKATDPGELSETGWTFTGWYKEQGCSNKWNFSTDVVNSSIILWAGWTVNTHKLSWDANGGTIPSTPSYTYGDAIAFGTAITKPGDPTRTGYDFAGWSPAIPATMPDNDLTFTAQWNPSTNTPYVVKHCQQNIADEHFTEVTADRENLTGTTGANVTPQVKTYTGFKSPAPQTKAISADGSTVIIYNYTRNEYTLTWNVGEGAISGNAHTSGQVKFGAPITAPANANVTRTGYDFAGWTPAVASTMPAANTTYTAQWNIKTYSGITFTSAAEDMGTVSVTGQKATYNYGDEVTITASPKAGYSFSKWSDNDITVSRTLRIGIDITSSLVASFTANTNTQYIVHHMKQNIDDDEYTEQLPVDYETGTTGQLTQAVEFEYVGFDAQLPIAQQTIKGDGSTEVFVYYNRKTFAIRFLVEGVVKQNETLRYGATPSYKLAAPTKAENAEFSYTFNGWTPAIAEVTQAQDYAAKFTENRKSYQISFDANGHGVAPVSQTIAYGSKVTKPADLSETGWTFGGWYKEAGCNNAWNFASETVTGAQTLYAKWTINKHNLRWNSNGGTLSGEHTGGIDADAQVAYGTAIQAPAAARQGYTFTDWGATVPATMPDNDLIFTAQWNANTNTAYKVEHYQQNLVGADYTLKETENKTGTTAANTTAAAKTYTGFTAKAFSQAAIAADGSTIVKIYYDRQVFEIKFVVEGAEVQSDNLRYGATPAYAGATPTKAATAQYTYTFSGWSPEIAVVTKAQTYTAQFSSTINKYTVVWKNEGGAVLETDENVPFGTTPSYDGATPTKAATAQYTYTHSGWTPAVVPVEGDAVYTATYSSTVNKYTVNFNANGHGSAPANQTIAYGSKVTKPADLSETGYTFGGWYKEAGCNNAWDFASDVVEGPVELFAKWTINSWTLTWDLNGGSIVSAGTPAGLTVFGTALTAPIVELTGYEFAGWNPSVPATMPDNNATYKATWSAAGDTHYTVKHFQQNLNDNDYTEVVADREDKTGATASQTAAIAKDYEGFEAKAFSQASIAANGSTVVEIYYDRKVFEIKFVVEGVAVKTDNLRFGATPVEPATPTKSADAQYTYTFDKWSPAVAVVTKAQTYEALFSSTINKYTIIWQNEDGTELEKDLNVEYGTLPSYNGATPTKAATAQYTYTFASWSPAVGLVEGDAVYTATYNSTVNNYTVSFNANGHGSAPAEQIIAFGGKASEPAALSETGYTFGGWYKEAGCNNAWNFASDVVEGPVELFAKWTVHSWTLTWNLDGGSIISAGTPDGLTEFGTALTAPTVEKTGYDFNGWSPAVPATMQDEDMTFTATWQEKGDIPYKVRHEKEQLDGNYVLDVEEDFTGQTGAEVTPLRKSYEGFTAPAAQTEHIAADGSLVITYQYTRNSYDLAWNANGGILTDNGYTRGSVKFEALIVAPADPTWVGHEFQGWDNVVPSTMPANNLTLTAQWTTNTYEGITFSSSDEIAGSVTVDPEQATYSYGDEVTITAEANDGYIFTGWSDGSDEANRTITVDENTEALVANFEAKTDLQYTIRHLKEKLDGSWEQDGIDSVRNDGVMAEWKTIEPKTYEGFKTPNAQTWKIAADGSTLFEYKYTRNSYELSWNANGGSLKENGRTEGLVKFEAPIVAAEAEWQGHTFKGWDTEVPATMPAHALSLTAQWEADVYDNISFASEDDEKGIVTVDPDKDEYTHGEEVTITAEANDGYTFTGWVDENGDVVSTNATTTIVIDENTGVITAQFEANTDTKFVIRRFLQNIDDDNFTLLDEEEGHGTTGATISPEPALIEGFTAPEVQSATIKGNGSTVIIYNYTRNSYSIEWIANGGELSGEYSQGSLKFEAPIVAPNISRIGHTFLGWGAEVPAKMPAEPLSFAAQWEVESIGSIIFTSNDDEAGSVTVNPEKDSYNYGDVVTVTATPNEGYTFTGWSDGGTGDEREITIDQNTPDSIIALFAPNQASYTILVLLQNIEDDEFTIANDLTMVQVGKTGDPIEPEEIEGFTAPEAQNLVIKTEGENIIELRYTRNSYNLVWNAAEGELSGEYTNGLVKFGAAIIAPADPVREGFTFIGWDAEIPATMPAADLTINALWEESQGIEIVVDGKTILCNEEIRIYDYNGRDVTGLNGNLGNGMYIIVGGGSATKVAIY